MAQWTNSSGTFFRPYRSPWGQPQLREFQESTGVAGRALAPGDLVRSNTVVTTGGFRVFRDPSTGGGGANLAHIGGAQLIGVCVDAPSTNSAAGATDFIDDSSQTGGVPWVRKINVALADNITEFLGYFKSGGAGATPGAFSSLIGLNRAVVRDSTLNRYFIDSTNSTAADAFVQIVDFPDFARGDSGGVPCVFKFLSSNVHPAVKITGNVV